MCQQTQETNWSSSLNCKLARELSTNWNSSWRTTPVYTVALVNKQIYLPATQPSNMRSVAVETQAHQQLINFCGQ